MGAIQGCSYLFLLVSVVTLTVFINHGVSAQEKKIIYNCCVPKEMLQDCENLGRGDSEVKCVLVQDSTDCALKLSRGEADFGLFSAEQAFVASYFMPLEGLNKVVVLGETRDGQRMYQEFAFTSVGIAKRSKVPSGNLLKEKELSLCHPGVGRLHSGWTDRVLKELDLAMVEQTKINRCDEWRSELENEITAISKVWGPSCRPGRWSFDPKTDKELKDQTPSLCQLCPDSQSCSYGLRDPESHQAALDCLKGDGSVAFVAQTYADEFIKNISREGENSPWALVCPDLKLGTNVSNCRWARQPWSGVAARNAVSKTLGPKLNEWLRPLNPRDLEGNATNVTSARRSDGWQGALMNIILDDSEVYMSSREILTLKDYMARGRRIPELEKAHSCTGPMRWCSKHDKERAKCDWMAIAGLTAGVPQPIKCLGSENHLACAGLITDFKADLVVADMDTAHVASMWEIENPKTEFVVGVSKYVETSSDKDRYIVALLPAESKIKNSTELQGLKGCLPFTDGLAYGSFLADAMSNELLPRTCGYPKAVDEYLADSCVPGSNRKKHPGLCELCQANTTTASNLEDKNQDGGCAATQANLFYDDAGALRCLHSGGGEFAYVDLNEVRDAIKDQTVPGINEDDFKVMCGDRGQVLPGNGLENGEICARARVPAGAVLTRTSLEPHAIDDVHNLLTSMDNLFGLQDANHPPTAFHMYRPFNNTRGLIFPFGTVGLLPKESKAPAVEGYLTLQVAVPKPCGSSGYNAATGLVASAATLLLSLAVFLTHIKL